MKSFTPIIFSLAATLVAAAPVAKREIAYYTVTSEVVETIDITTTIWVPAGGAPLAATTTPVSVSESSSASAPPTSAAPAPAPTTTSGAAFIQVTTTAAKVTSVAAVVATTAAPTTAAPPLPASSTSAAPASSAPATPASPGSILSPPYPLPAAGPLLTGAKINSGCTSGAKCHGDITHYNPEGGYGACGTILQQSDNIVAIPWQMMGTVSNGNPLCGKKVSLTDPHTGKSTTATVADKCGGCNNPTDVDLTSSLFEFFYPGTVTPDGGSTSTDPGRVHGVEWFFTD